MGNFKIGKVYDYDGKDGKVVTNDKVYYFNNDNLYQSNDINNQDIVVFKNYGEDVFPEARYVKKINLKVVNNNTK